jgi:uncharacterized membrane protein
MPYSETALPASYQEADAASRLAQKRYIAMFRRILVSTGLSALSTWSAHAVPSYIFSLGFAAVVFALISLVLTLVLKERRYENSWYMGRAIAESIKTRSWSYMMRANPYAGNMSEDDIDRSFIRDLGNILKEKGPLVLSRPRDGNESEISEIMCKTRSASLAERKDIYLAHRIVDQKKWYGSKAAASNSKENQVFIAVIIIQIAAVVIGFLALAESHAPSGLVSVLASFSSATLAWLQVKKYQETAQSYSVTSQELGFIEALARTVSTEEQFSLFVENAEFAISREHTLWIARRTSK